ncbi:MAG: hypothetical protein CVU79_08890 [Elusimicrobia bacterium HGW-Elusimicrobia-3]|jgi:type II secretory pathway pseudopilin PulG|nr:MAG: hypothetical protein CVU79_08890 [Elusimicrobia bacterium HGW-Elusimicrobia-3]
MKRRIIMIILAAAALAGAGWGIFHLRRGMGAAEVVRKLSGIRLALELYRQEHKKYPASFGETLRAGTLEAAPDLKLPGHFKNSQVRDTPSLAITDSGGWAYVSDRSSPDFGLLYIDCSHRDEKSRFWSEF